MATIVPLPTVPPTLPLPTATISALPSPLPPTPPTSPPPQQPPPPAIPSSPPPSSPPASSPAPPPPPTTQPPPPSITSSVEPTPLPIPTTSIPIPPIASESTSITETISITSEPPPPDPTTTTTPISPPTSTTSSSHAALIAGGTIGGIATLFILLLITYFCICRRKRRYEFDPNSPIPTLPHIDLGEKISSGVVTPFKLSPNETQNYNYPGPGPAAGDPRLYTPPHPNGTYLQRSPSSDTYLDDPHMAPPTRNFERLYSPPRPTFPQHPASSDLADPHMDDTEFGALPGMQTPRLYTPTPPPTLLQKPDVGTGDGYFGLDDPNLGSVGFDGPSIRLLDASRETDGNTMKIKPGVDMDGLGGSATGDHYQQPVEIPPTYDSIRK